MIGRDVLSRQSGLDLLRVFTHRNRQESKTASIMVTIEFRFGLAAEPHFLRNDRTFDLSVNTRGKGGNVLFVYGLSLGSFEF